MEVKVKVIIRKRNFFALFFGPKLGRMRKTTKKWFHRFFYRWNMFFMGTNRNTPDVVIWDISTLAGFILLIVLMIASFI